MPELHVLLLLTPALPGGTLASFTDKDIEALVTERRAEAKMPRPAEDARWLAYLCSSATWGGAPAPANAPRGPTPQEGAACG